MANEVWYINSNDEEVYYDSITGEKERTATVKELESVRDNSKQNLLNIDKSYIRREGISFLQDNNKSENLKSKGIFEVYEEETPRDEEEKQEELNTDKSISEALDIKNINIEQDISTVKSWATPEIKRTGEQLNKIKTEIDNFMMPKALQIRGGKELNKILGKEEKSPLTYNDLKKLEKIFDDNVKEMERLYKEEQDMKRTGIKSNDDRRINIRKQINKLYYRWTNEIYRRGTKPTIKFRPSPNSALSVLRGGLEVVKRKEIKYNNLKTKYDKDLARSQK